MSPCYTCIHAFGFYGQDEVDCGAPIPVWALKFIPERAPDRLLKANEIVSCQAYVSEGVE